MMITHIAEIDRGNGILDKKLSITFDIPDRLLKLALWRGDSEEEISLELLNLLGDLMKEIQDILVGQHPIQKEQVRGSRTAAATQAMYEENLGKLSDEQRKRMNEILRNMFMYGTSSWKSKP